LGWRKRGTVPIHEFERPVVVRTFNRAVRIS